MPPNESPKTVAASSNERGTEENAEKTKEAKAESAEEKPRQIPLEPGLAAITYAAPGTTSAMPDTQPQE